LPTGPVVCILGEGDCGNGPAKEVLEGIAHEACGAFVGAVVTTGTPGLQEAFARACRDESKVWNLMPVGSKSAYNVGADAHVGGDQQEWKRVFGQLGDVYFIIGEDTSTVAEQAHKRGAAIVPLIRIGGMCPRLSEEELRAQAFVDIDRWALLADETTSAKQTADAAISIMRSAANKAIMDDPLKWCPRWVINDAVWKFLPKWQSAVGKDAKLPLGCVCGGGVVWAAMSNLFTWPAYIFFAFLAYWSCSCGKDGFLAHYNSKIWIAFTIFFVTQAYFEFKALGYVIFSQVQVTGPFKFLGNILTFKRWAILMTWFSLINHMDIATNGFFLATTVATASCPMSVSRLNPIWTKVMEQSVFGHIPGAAEELTTANIAFVFWALTFLQPLYAILVAMPLSPAFWKVTYKPAMKEPGYEPVLKYKTALDECQNHGNALMASAEVARMGSVTFQDLSFAMAKFELALQKLIKTHQPKDAQECLHHATGLFHRSTYRYVFQGLFETSLQMNLQISLLGIQRAAAGPAMRTADELGAFATLRALNPQTLFSILLTMIMSIKRAYEVIELIQKANRISKGTQEQKVNDCQIQFLLRMYYDIWTKSARSYFGVFIFLASVLYAALKYWAIFYCPSSLWNFAWYPPHGCVQL